MPVSGRHLLGAARYCPVSVSVRRRLAVCWWFVRVVRVVRRQTGQFAAITRHCSTSDPLLSFHPLFRVRSGLLPHIDALVRCQAYIHAIVRCQALCRHLSSIVQREILCRSMCTTSFVRIFDATTKLLALKQSSGRSHKEIYTECQHNAFLHR